MNFPGLALVARFFRSLVADGEETCCESCGAVPDVRVRDGSTWCFKCHIAALDAGYDTDRGTILKRRVSVGERGV